MRSLLTLSLAAGLPLAALAQDPRPTAPFQPATTNQTQRVAVPRSQFEVTPQAGAWLICAATYTGPNANYYAEQVVRQLRDKHRMPAYIFNYADLQRQKEEEEYKRWQAEHPDIPSRRRVTRIESQCVVLAGGYKDDVAANKALVAFKKLPPPQVFAPDGQPVGQRIEMKMTYDAPPKVGRGSAGVTEPAEKLGDVFLNPFARSFAIRNPSLPKQQTAGGDKPDPFWKTLNAHEDYSLLKCKKSFTLVIKCFAGTSTIQQTDASGPRKTSLFGSRDVLQASAMQAHELARFLRDNCKMESYVLHMRQGSIVTVGAFDSLDDPKLVQMQQQLRKGDLRQVNGPGLGTGLHELIDEPMPMRVPKL